MSLLTLVLALMVGTALARRGGSRGDCPKVDTISRSMREDYCDQPLFINFLPKTEENMLLDNICTTYFPLPDDPSTFQVYHSRVYCDGSTEVVSYIGTDISPGVHRFANPFVTATYQIFGYAGCDTYLVNVCTNYGDTSEMNKIHGLSSSCKPIGLSCLRKVEEIVRDNCIPDQEYYVLPMKLPNRCVTQQHCIASQGNQFYKALGLAGPLIR